MIKPDATHKRDLFIYQVYVRNHTKAGTFNALKADLDRIKKMGVDMIYLLPIHPIGELKRKGKLGSPYAIKDYFAINEELGTMDDFKNLIGAIHDKGMKVMMDIVYNHTSPDSTLIQNHPEYFYTENGEFKNRVGDWWDITDFDFSKGKEALETILIDALKQYTNMGVDGYRFDVASIIPRSFLAKARKTIDALNPDTVWLSESVHGHFLKEIRDRGFDALSESEIYEVFDMAYDYDAHPYFEAYLKNEGPLNDYIHWLQKQEEIYPKDYVKMRNLENHDFGRIAELLNEDVALLKQWHAFNFFQKGSTMIFSGSEVFTPHHPDLFNKDTIDFTLPSYEEWVTKVNELTRGELFTFGVYEVKKAKEKDVITASYKLDAHYAYGVFNVSKSKGKIKVDIKDGIYQNHITNENIEVKNGELSLINEPIIIKY